MLKARNNYLKRGNTNSKKIVTGCGRTSRNFNQSFASALSGRNLVKYTAQEPLHLTLYPKDRAQSKVFMENLLIVQNAVTNL